MERKFQGDRRIEDGGLCILFWLPSSLKLRCDKTPQNIEAPLNANNIHLDNQSRFCCQDFSAGVAIADQFESARCG
jgi:hypothetical protein